MNPEYRFTLVPVIVGCLGAVPTTLTSNLLKLGISLKKKSSSSPLITESHSHWTTKSDENSHENVLKKHIKRKEDSRNLFNGHEHVVDNQNQP